ncbi:GNAT family N-acetyltransferase [Aquitalea magnusonii]|uniref:GNAT family N-acetyltransferase n=1 Tax=Aquitalea magnusonii TaxID=332411 RepID=UPI000B5C5C1F|nr:GNAT family N-acetyltransferase [Aquitalea magnusonii]
MTCEEITLRQAQLSDEKFLLDLRQQVMTEHLARVGEPTDDDSHLQRVRYQYDGAQIVLINGNAVGLMKVFKTEKEWNLIQVQILPRFQGKGIGRFLIYTLLEDAKRNGVVVRLSVLRGNPARHLYEKLGFCLESETGKEYCLVFKS